MTVTSRVAAGLDQLRDRAAVVGVRQLGHPLQGLRPAGRARATRTRRSPTPRRCTAYTGVAPSRGAAHPVGPGRRLRQARRARSRPRRPHRRDQRQRVPGRRLQARQRRQPRSARPPQGDRPPARVRRHHGRDRLARPQAVVRRRHQLPGPGLHRAPARTGSPRRSPRRTQRLGDGPAACCSSTSSSSRRSTRPTCPTGAPPSRTASRSATGRRWSSTPDTTRPGTNIEFIVRCCCALDKLGGFDFNSRFYADDDLMVGAADPFQLFRIMHEIVPGGALDPASGVAFMLDQCHNIEEKIPASHPLGDERPGGDGEGAARRRRRAARGAARRRRARRQRRADGRVQHRRAPAARRATGRPPASTRTRSPPTAVRATPSRSAPSASAASRPGGGHDRHRQVVSVPVIETIQ